MKKTYITPKNKVIELDDELLLSESSSSKMSIDGFEDLGWGGIYSLDEGGD